MNKVLLYSLLLVGGLAVSQIVGEFASPYDTIVRISTMVGLSFIMVHVGYEFDIDKGRPRQYLFDYGVAFTAAALPWLFCALYFVYVMAPAELWSHPDLWRESLLEARFASPTSAGVLFSMLAAAGLAATWLFKKARILAIFDDLDTILLMIPLKIMMVGFRWQLAGIVVAIGLMLWFAWRYLHVLRLPVTWPWVLTYSVLISAASEFIYVSSKALDSTTPVHLEVLLPAFVLGCMLARPKGEDPHDNDAIEGTEHGPASASEQRAATIISALFMVLVGLSMPPVTTSGASAPDTESPISALAYEGADPAAVEEKQQFPGWGMIAVHVLLITILSNLGKMFPVFVYREEASFRERLALCVGMFPRGEVGAGVLVISISYGISGPALSVAVLSLALNLVATGLFIMAVKKLIDVPQPLSVNAS